MHHLRPQKPKKFWGRTPKPPWKRVFHSGYIINKHLHTLTSSALRAFRLFCQNPFWSLCYSFILSIFKYRGEKLNMYYSKSTPWCRMLNIFLQFSYICTQGQTITPVIWKAYWDRTICVWYWNRSTDLQMLALILSWGIAPQVLKAAHFLVLFTE